MTVAGTGVTSINFMYVCMYICMCSIIMESSPNNRHTIEGQYGSMPTDTETFSLWLTALSNIPDKGQYQLLLCRDTVHRLQKCVVRIFLQKNCLYICISFFLFDFLNLL